MNGFISFVLVFASIAIILVILSANANVSYSKEIELKRLHSLELDIKNALLDAAHTGANDAVKKYIGKKIAEAAANEMQPIFDTVEMKKLARNAAHGEMKKLADFNMGKPYHVRIWCGFADEASLRHLRDRMFGKKDAAVCEHCFSIEDEACSEFIQINLDMNLETPTATVQFWKEQAMDIGIIGISVYFEKPQVAAVSYIPISEVR